MGSTCSICYVQDVPTDVSNFPLSGVVLIQSPVFADVRGFFLETWQHERYQECGLPTPFAYDNRSFSVRGTFRKLRFQPPQWSSRFCRAPRRIGVTCYAA